jgi:hypothetical protein
MIAGSSTVAIRRIWLPQRGQAKTAGWAKRMGWSHQPGAVPTCDRSHSECFRRQTGFGHEQGLRWLAQQPQPELPDVSGFDDARADAALARQGAQQPW